ncbi:MAG: hydroxymethylglutaryl-CoA reductase, degradative [Flavobacteriaceae bacterium]
MQTPVSGFSKRSKKEKIAWIVENHFHDTAEAKATVEKYWHQDEQLQQLHDDFIENTISNYYLPLGVAPNFNINGTLYTIPMAIEESSVVAAASKAAKYWGDRGGFTTQILGEEKIGQIHFIFSGDSEKLAQFIQEIEGKLRKDVAALTANMEKRGGGIRSIELRDKTELLEDYYQLHLCFLTADSMGANFINSCLEAIAKKLQEYIGLDPRFTESEKKCEIVMSILSNYVPNCIAKARVCCPVDELEQEEGLSQQAFAEKFVRAVKIAQKEPFRAVTHNKGIMNGVDAVVIATGNDFRAVEAGVHAYAARNGQYSSLSHAYIEDGKLHFELTLPLAIGTVGGLTKLHPLVKWSLGLLGNPSATELMQIIVVAGLAQNFAAVRSLVTSGIQKGHMKMHLLNILNQLNASPSQKEAAIAHFKTTAVSHSAVAQFLENNS